MRVPPALQPLLDAGIIDQVFRPLMSGKEAEVYLVGSDGHVGVAKLYKEASNRSFKHRIEYTEGRKVRNSRQQRAMEKRSKYGREQEEQAWRSAEVDVIYRLREANVRVPEPYTYVDGVLVMELVQDEFGEPAPRLVDGEFTEDEAWDLFHVLLREVVKMLCAGVVHGDLSDFNVLLAHDGPVIIDFPQAVDPANNRNARDLLIRDVDNLASFLARHTEKLKRKQYGEEMWALYESGVLTPDSKLTGKYENNSQVDLGSLLAEIEEVEREARARREALGLDPIRPARKPVEMVEAPRGGGRGGRDGGRGGRPGGGATREQSAPSGRGAPGAQRGRDAGRGAGRPAPRSIDEAFAVSDDLDDFLSFDD